MGNDPKTSVVNRDCQVHDVDNVYVIDASVHVTNGGFNPALTIMANAYRASANLLQGLEGIEGARREEWFFGAGLVVVALRPDGAGREPLLRIRAREGGCTSCHEMQPLYDQLARFQPSRTSPARSATAARSRRTSPSTGTMPRASYAHLRGDLPEQIGFPNSYVAGHDRAVPGLPPPGVRRLAGRPAQRHLRAHLSRPEITTSANMLMDDCLRCHGMHFEGGIRDLVTPVARSGPWRLVPAELAEPARHALPDLPRDAPRRPAHGKSRTSTGRVPGPRRRSRALRWRSSTGARSSYIPLADLPLPAMLDGDRPVRMSHDQRQALCYQCHAPVSTMQVASGDDRTGIGVHEGISCLACHRSTARRPGRPAPPAIPRCPTAGSM